MDTIELEKIQAFKKYKKNQSSLNNLFLYTLTSLVCSLLVFSPFWYPTLVSSMQVFLRVTLPKIVSFFFNPKSFFIIGNLIVVVLVGESKIFSSNKSFSVVDSCYDEYVSKSRRNVRNFYEHELKHDKFDKLEVMQNDHEEEEEELSLPTEELNKRADDLIARVTKQRMLEAKLY